MEKLFTVVVAREEDCKKFDRLIEDLGLNIADYDKSKKLKVRGENDYELMVYSIVCTEEVFLIITKALNGIRIY